MTDAIAQESRVTHIADRNRDVPRPGTVELVWTSPNGGTYARVAWDNGDLPNVHPVNNLVLTKA